ncbi:MAG TPA: hypothetical protein VHN98_13320 [Acidimicrobiales bacterium]|nr:hypothetical protein [Acidimicrobiales bacterium]
MVHVTRRLRLAPGRRDDEGSTLLVAVMVMMILATLSLASLTRTLSTLKYVRHGQDYDAALALADAGLSQAVYTITQTMPNGTTTIPQTSSGQGWYTARLEKVNLATYRVYSKGVVGSSQHAIQALVTRSAEYPFLFFSDQNLYLDGTAGGPTINFYTYNSVGPVSGAPPNVGSNSSVVCRGGGSGFATYYVKTQTDCPTPSGMPHVVELDPVTVPSGPTQSCGDGNFGDTSFNMTNWIAWGSVTADLPVTVIDGQNGTPIVCSSNPVHFYGLVQVVNPPAKIYVMNQTVDISNAIINVANPSLNVPGKASDFQLFVKGDGTIDIGSGDMSSTLSFSGIIYAPTRSITVNGGRWWTGAFVASQLKVNGSPNLNIGYDEALKSYYDTAWSVSRYREVSAASVNL